MQSYVSTTQVTNEWAMSMIEDNSATPREPSSVRAWMESSKYRWLARNQRWNIGATTYHVQAKMWSVLNQV